MGGGEVLWCSQILQLLDGQPTNWKILHRGVSLLDRVLSPGAGSAAWVPGVERRSPGALGCEGQRVRSCKDWGKGDSTLGECPWGFTGAGTQAKQWLRRNPARHICGCGGSPGEAGSADAHGGARTPVAEAPGSIHRRELSQRPPFGHRALSLPRSLQPPVLRCPRPGSQQRGDADRPSATGRPESRRAQRSHAHTDVAVPTEGHASLHPEWAGASLSHRELPKP